MCRLLGPGEGSGRCETIAALARTGKRGARGKTLGGPVMNPSSEQLCEKAHATSAIRIPPRLGDYPVLALCDTVCDIRRGWGPTSQCRAFLEKQEPQTGLRCLGLSS